MIGEGKRYVSVPVEVDVLQFLSSTINDIPVFTNCESYKVTYNTGRYGCLITIKGVTMQVMETDYLVKEVQTPQIVSVVKQSDFESKYKLKEEA